MLTSRIWKASVLSGVVLASTASTWAEDMAASAPPAEQKEQAKPNGDRKERSEDDRAKRGEAMRKRIHEALFKDISLSEEQQAKVKDVMEKGRTEREAWMQEHGEELRKIRTDMREAREAGDEEGVRDARASLEALMKDAPRPDRYYDEVKTLLTEEQAAQFAKNADEMRQRWREFRGGGQRGPGGPGGPDGERRRPKDGEGDRKPAQDGPTKASGDKLDL